MSGDFRFVYPLILLAAGRSQRMGSPKGLLDFQGMPWIVHQLLLFKKVGGTHAIVVVGHGSREYRQAIDGARDLLTGLRVQCVLNTDPDRGTFSSVQVGIAATLEGSSADRHRGPRALLPMDVPVPAVQVWCELAKGFQESGCSVAVPEYQGRGGHPVLLSSEFATRLVGLPLQDKDSRLDRQIQLLPLGRVRRQSVISSETLLNLNDPAQWTAYLAQRSVGPFNSTD